MVIRQSIGIFDSGIGGLSVLNLLKSELPNENFIYVADNINLPYGEKTPEEIARFSKNIINFLISQNVKLIVVACNTSSAILIDNNFSIPIFNIIESVAKHIAPPNKNCLGLIATQATINSNSYEKRFKNYNPNIEITQISCPKLVPIIENNFINQQETYEILKDYLSPIIQNNHIEELIYGCTHYPYLDHIVKKILNIKTIDPAQYILLDIKKYLCQNELCTTKGYIKYYITGSKKQFFDSAKVICGTINYEDIMWIPHLHWLKKMNYENNFCIFNTR